MRQAIVARLQKTRNTSEARQVLEGYRRDILNAIELTTIQDVHDRLGVDPIKELMEVNVALGDAGLIEERDGSQ